MHSVDLRQDNTVVVAVDDAGQALRHESLYIAHHGELSGGSAEVSLKDSNASCCIRFVPGFFRSDKRPRRGPQGLLRDMGHAKAMQPFTH